MEHQEIVSLSGISKTYGSTTVLSDINLTIHEGEVIGLLGDNGAGKSTLVKILSGIVTASKGEFSANGDPVPMTCRADSQAVGIETIYQDIAMVPYMSIFRNMFLGREIKNRFGLMRRKLMKEETAKILREGVEISGIDDPEKPVGSLSGGQQQAVAIARAVHFRNKVLVLDEPTSALSIRETESVLRYITTLREEGIASVFVTHNLYHAFKVCDRFIVLSHGKIVLDAPKSETSVEQLTELIVAT